MPVGEIFSVKRWGLNDECVWWHNNVNAVLCCSVMLVSLSAGVSAAVRESPLFTLTLLQCSTDLHCFSLSMWDADDKVEIAGARIEPSLCRRFNEEDGLYRESFCDGEFELLLGVSSVIDRSHTLNAGDLRSRWYTIINGVFLIRFTRVSTDGLIINVRRLNIQRPQRLLGFALLDIRSGQ